MITGREGVLNALADRKACACFTGHRPNRLPDEGDTKAVALLCEKIEAEIIRAYEDGKRFFLHGMMAGFDILAAETVAAGKTVLPGDSARFDCSVPSKFFKVQRMGTRLDSEGQVRSS